MTQRKQTPGEEIANSVSHGAGAVAGIAALTVLLVYSIHYGDAWHVISAGIYGASLTILYGASTLYHSIRNPAKKKILRVIDHSSVFLLIAGTYTPLTLVSLRGPWGWTLFGLIWGLAIFGIVFKSLFFAHVHNLSLVLYLSMGWLAVIAIKPLIDRLPASGLAWLAGGGIVYSLGVIFYKQEKLPYAHAIWHAFVIAGSVAHFIAIFFYVMLPVRG